jgi:hypothetical protein
VSLLLLLAATGSSPPVEAQRLVLPITGTVTATYPWGSEAKGLPRGAVDESARITGTVGKVT